MVTNYRSQRDRITSYVKNVVHTLAEHMKDGDLKIILAQASIDLGVSKDKVLEILRLYEDTGILKINESKNAVVLYTQ